MKIASRQVLLHQIAILSWPRAILINPRILHIGIHIEYQHLVPRSISKLLALIRNGWHRLIGRIQIKAYTVLSRLIL
jgi:hypothetical protein